MIEWRQKKKKTKKSPGLPTNPPPKKKSLDQKLTPQKSHAEFPSLKTFQKGLNEITRTKKKNI